MAAQASAGRITSIRNRLAGTVGLYKALGGGWSADTAQLALRDADNAGARR